MPTINNLNIHPLIHIPGDNETTAHGSILKWLKIKKRHGVLIRLSKVNTYNKRISITSLF